MFRLLRPVRSALVAVLLAAPLVAETPALRLRADYWMPYNGEAASSQPGYVIEIVRHVFESRGVPIDYQVMPWTEALEEAQAGRIDGVIGANPAEAGDLVIPSEPIGAPQPILLTLRTSTWRYENLLSFRDVKLGVSDGYSYWPGLDKYIEQPANAPRLFVAGGENPLEQLLGQLDRGEIDVMVDFEAVLLWELRQRGLKATDYRAVYKHKPDPIYIAFAANERGRAFAAVLDEGLQALRASGELEKILRRYGLGDWK